MPPAPRPQVGLACIRIGLRPRRVGPLADARRTRVLLGRGPSVPIHLLHVVIELDGVAGRVEHVGAVVDAGVSAAISTNLPPRPFRKSIAARSWR